MATRSTIAVQHEDGTVTSVYCHFDGYLEHAGKMLFTHYNSLELAEKLVSGGSLSQINERIAPVSAGHNYANPEKGVCVYYARDRSERLVTEEFGSFADYLLGNSREDYNYLFVEGEWKLVRRNGAVSLAKMLAETGVEIV